MTGSGAPRVALIGVGRFGVNHLRVLRQLDRERTIEFAGVVGRSPRRARQLAERFGVRAYPSLAHALGAGLDVVDVATPSSTHAALVRRCLPAAHVFVEKPLALTVDECARLYRLARAHSRLLGVGHIFRFNAAVARAKAILRGRARPYLIRAEITGWSPPPGDTGAIVTYLHVFDLLDELLEKAPLSTVCVGRVTAGRDHFERQATLVLRYSGGLSAVLEVGWIGGQRRRVLEISLPRLFLRCDLVRQIIELHRPGRPTVAQRLYRREPLRLELEDFVRAVRRGGGLRPEPAAVLRVMRMVRDAERSARLGRPVRWRG